MLCTRAPCIFTFIFGGIFEHINERAWVCMDLIHNGCVYGARCCTVYRYVDWIFTWAMYIDCTHWKFIILMSGLYGMCTTETMCSFFLYVTLHIYIHMLATIHVFDTFCVRVCEAHTEYTHPTSLFTWTFDLKLCFNSTACLLTRSFFPPLSVSFYPVILICSSSLFCSHCRRFTMSQLLLVLLLLFLNWDEAGQREWVRAIL